MILSVQISILIVFIIISALFSGIETALISLSRAKVKTLVKQKKPGSLELQRIKNDPHKLIITILIINNLVNIASASLATVIFTNLLGSSGVGIATGIMTITILIFGEITPKTYASQNAQKISLIAAKPLELISILLSPLVWVFDRLSTTITKIFGPSKETKFSEDEMRTIVTMGHEEGIISGEAAEMMQNIMEFDRTKVAKIMTPRSSIESIDGNTTIREVLDQIIRTSYSRYPVYLDETNNIVGVLDIDDVLKNIKNKRLNVRVKNILRPVQYIPETKEIDELLLEFEGSETPIALVVDEYENITGLVTMEDILEEIVGEIFDKSKKKSVILKKINSKAVIVDAKAPLDELSTFIELDGKDTQFNTIAGFIMARLQHIPNSGEEIQLKNAKIVVDKVTRKGIQSVKILSS